MPLVHARAEGPAPEGRGAEVRERARKIRPELARGELVRVAGGRNQAEAELIQNLLLEEGVPSLVRRAAGFDVPDFLAAGPRDVLVPESGAAAARALLRSAELHGGGQVLERPGAATGAAARMHAARLLAAIVAGALVAAALAWALARLAA